MLKPQDILVLLKLVTVADKSWVYNKLAVELEMSSSNAFSFDMGIGKIIKII